ncbi:MAG TPA: methylated-DNA--[protein]-cysteine S-methyltransferase [Chitinophagaceae bacterium]|nr:methylated-DNA--[protein]-cysteine S-methyltransferase [Chitinophagaceae bacterium]
MNTDYERIEKAIRFIKDNFQQQPDLDEVARQVYLSPYHFQRLFKDWAGVSPKKFLQYISLEHAKHLLNNNASLADASFETGLSGTSRLHDLFVTIEGMTPGEFKNGGENLYINYSYAETPFGNIIIASTQKGICHIAFAGSTEEALRELQQHFPQAAYNQKTDMLQQNALQIFTGDWHNLQQVKLHLKGTVFQLKVWEALLRIPAGKVSTYSAIAGQLQSPNASRAVGSAVGANPVAYLIPCHRVIRATGVIGGYHWGSTRKTAILGWEAAHTDAAARVEN